MFDIEIENKKMEFPIYKNYLQSLPQKSDEILFKEQVEEQVQKHVSFIVKKVLETATEVNKTTFVYDSKSNFALIYK